jgi:hypothetical protein
LRSDELVVEDPAGHIQEVAHQRVAERVANGESFLLGGENGVVPQHGQLLGHERLGQVQGVLKFLDRAAPAHEDLENLDARGMSEGAEELGFEGSEGAGGHVAVPVATLHSHFVDIIC